MFCSGHGVMLVAGRCVVRSPFIGVGTSMSDVSMLAWSMRQPLHFAPKGGRGGGLRRTSANLSEGPCFKFLPLDPLPPKLLGV